jgi:hypothetical protein
MSLDLWAYTNGITLDVSRPGKPTDNYMESFNVIVRLERLGRHWFPGPGRCPVKRLKNGVPGTTK